MKKSIASNAVKKRDPTPESGSRHQNAGTPVSSQDAAAYIHEMCIELRDMAVSVKLTFLAYLLDLVIEESALKRSRGN